MAAPTFQAAGTALTSAGTTISPAWPTHVTGDLGVLVVETSGNSATMATPTGWYVMPGGLPAVDVATTAGSKLHVFFKIATSSAEPAVATGALTDHILAQIVTFRGVNGGIPIEAYAVSTKTTASTTVTLPSVVTNTTDTLVVFVASRPDLSASTTNFGVPVNAGLTGLAEIGEAGTASGNGGGFVVSYGIRATPGTVTTSTMTSVASTTNCNVTFALKAPTNAAATPLFMTSLIKDANLVAYYKMDTDSTDIKGGFNGTDTSMTYTTGQGRFGQGAGFSGSGLIALPSTFTLGTVSICGWLNFTNTAATYDVIRFAANSNQSMGISSNRGAAGRIDAYTFNSPTFNNIETPWPVSDGAWHHLVYTRSGTTAQFYVDGTSMGTSAVFDSSTFGGTQNSLGNNVGITGGFYIGNMDDVAIFSRVLTAAEVAGLWNGTLTSSSIGSLLSVGVGA